MSNALDAKTHSSPSTEALPCPNVNPLPHIDARLHALTGRIRVQRALASGMRLLPHVAASMLLLAASAALHITTRAESACAALLTLVAYLALACIHAAQPVDRTRLATKVDHALGLKGRIANAWSLRADASPFAALAREDAESHARAISPARLAPIRLPWREGVLPMFVLALATILFTQEPQRAAPQATAEQLPQATHADIATLDQDALDALQGRLAAVPHTGAEDAETDALNALIEDIASGTLTNDAALERLLTLEDAAARAQAQASEHAEAIRTELADAARAMRPLPSTDALRAALTAGELERARDALRARASAGAAPTPAEIENLRTLAADAEREAREAALEEAEAEEERLLHRQREGGAETPEEERLLQQRQRELDTLRREHEQRQAAERELDRLRRELDEAADAMERNAHAGNDPSQDSEAGEAMERAAEELNRQAEAQGSAESLQQLQREIERLREALRDAQRQREEGRDQQGRGGQGNRSEDAQGEGQAARMRRFVMRAQGEGEGEEGGMRLGVRRPGTSGTGSEGGEGEAEGAGNTPQPGSEGSPSGQEGEGATGEGQQATGQRGEGNLLVLGEGGNAQVEIPGMRGAPGGQQGASGPRGEGEGNGQGAGHAPTSLDEATARLGTSQNSQLNGAPGNGPSRSEVIRGGAARGFATRDYERVYGDYASHAEESLEHDRVPPGYRTFVERYFDLIRPRTDAPPPSSP